MTPKRWHEIDNIFDAALRVDPAERDDWLDRACGRDGDLRAEIDRLLAQDERAAREGFLTPPEAPVRPPHQRRTGAARRDHLPPGAPEPSDHAPAGVLDDTGCFAPKAAIASRQGSRASAETRAVVRARMRELPIIFILIFGMAFFWRYVVLRDSLLAIALHNVVVLVALGGIAAVLWGRRPLSLARLETLELVMIVLLATLGCVSQYQLMLMYSLRADPLGAQMVMRNVVLRTSILILTYALYVPKSWRRAALVTGSLAALPFATLLVLYLRNPEAMGWLERGWANRRTTPMELFSFDAMLLLILAIGSTYGAATMFRLRRQVVEARQLGQYRLWRRLGAGGMGEVYLAEHQLLKRPCALKLILPDREADPKTLDRFEREVRLTATLSHPNTVEIFDYGRTEEGTYYYVMEYLPGLSLADLVKAHGPLPPARAVYLLRQVCLALREAHTSGLVHRDVKPSNIFAARRGGADDVAKLLDFGLVLPVAAGRAPHLPREDKVIGTPMFMSPEQVMNSQELDERSDIYSLGAVAYYLLTGRPPFDEGGGIAVMIAHTCDPVVPPSSVRASIPRDLENVVLRCLAKEPADRFQDARSLELALGECVCAGEWDQERASAWWRDVGPAGRCTETSPHPA
ncbi:MAG: serine/threonine-protein kinase [Isosphaerales bacterium]